MTKSLTKADLVSSCASSANLPKAQVEKVINSMMSAIQGALERKMSVTLVGFGTFTTGDRKARNGRNPKTGATLKIPASTVPKFRPGKGLKEAVNKK
ncbi:MAG: HU family DNA-binding protein [SAR324 cluster bacterium]|nr:HU family DNA-binding protein [SAR324 cluster bacterium]